MINIIVKFPGKKDFIEKYKKVFVFIMIITIAIFISGLIIYRHGFISIIDYQIDYNFGIGFLCFLLLMFYILFKKPKLHEERIKD